MRSEEKSYDVSTSDVFAAKVTAVDGTAVLIEIPGFADDKATGLLKAEAT